MYLHNFDPFVQLTSEKDRHEVRDALLRCLDEGLFFEGVNRFLAAVPVRAPKLFGDAYYESNLRYNLGLMLAHLGQTQEAANMMSKSKAMACGDWQDLPFPLHQRVAEDVHRLQVEAIERECPTVLLTSLPRSASAFLSQELAGWLGAQVMRASIGSFPNNTVVPSWITQIAKGGCVSHDHFDGGDENVHAILSSGITRVLVQVRDPRAISWSLCHHNMKLEDTTWDSDTLYTNMQKIYEFVFNPAIAWIESWLGFVNAVPSKLQVDFVLFEDLASEPRHVVQELLSTYSETAHVEEHPWRPPPNYRSGSAPDWQSGIPKDIQEKMWRTITQPVKNLLRLSD